MESEAESAHRTCKIANMICKVRSKRPLFANSRPCKLGLGCRGKGSKDFLTRKCDPGHVVDTLYLLGKAGRSKTNATRNLTRLLESKGVMLPLKPDLISITVKRKRKQNKVEQIWFPILRMSEWLRCLIKHYPAVLLAGHQLDDVTGWQSTFENFWTRYAQVDGTHPIYAHESAIPWKMAVPYLLHGDEGRGQRQVPYMVEAWQLLIGYQGVESTNESS